MGPHVPFPERFDLRGTGVRLAGDRWRAEGSTRTVLLLHGGGQTRHSWSRTAARLAARGFTAIALDARGHGDSAWAEDGDYGLDAILGDLRAAVTELELDEPVLVGASMGGLTALIAEGEAPGLAGALVLVDVVPRVETIGVDRIRKFMTESPDGFASLEDVVHAIRAYNPHRTRPVNLEGVKKNVRLRDGRWYWHWDPKFMSIGDEPRRLVRPGRARDAAARIQVPTLLVRGAQSDIVSDEGVREFLQMIPHARYFDVTGTGHMVAGDDNDVFTARMSEFFDEALGPSQPTD